MMLLLALLAGHHVSAAPPPHIIFIMADDLGSNDVGYNDPTLLSPEIDQLAKDGVRLTACYTWSWCAPSRGAMLSGRYAPNTGFEGAGGATKSGKGKINVFPLDVPMLPAVLKKAGYATLMAGKWHLGFARQADLPENRGFDAYLGYLSGGEDYYDHSAGGGPGCSKANDLWFGTPNKGHPPRNSTGYYSGIYSTELYADFIVKRINGHDPTTPLFVYAAFQGVHYPLQVPRRFFDRYASQGAGSGDCAWEKQKNGSNGYPNGFECTANADFPHLRKPGLDCECNRLLVKAQVSSLSEAVGNITTALRTKGMWNNTVLVFMGDNGTVLLTAATSPLYSYSTLTLLIPYSYCFTRTVLVLYSYCARTLLVLYSYFTRTVIVLYSYCDRTLLVL
jgi:arylsulfatase A-like enzyme